jgi:3-dehydroquinate synthase
LDSLIEGADALGRCDEAAIERAVRASALIHLDHIRCGGDAFETGSSRPLDFGHWAAHHIEAATEYALRHGEAVAIGVALDLCIAAELGVVSRDELESVLDAMERAGLELWHDVLTARGASGELELMVGLERFREHLGGELTLAMPDGLGRRRDIHELRRDTVARALARLERRDSACAAAMRISRTA